MEHSVKDPEARQKPAPEENARRRQILDAARRMFSRSGYHGVTMRGIAAEAGLNSAAHLYFYFPSKADLYRETVTEMTAPVQEMSLSEAALDRPPERALASIARAYLRLFDDEETVVRAVGDGVLETLPIVSISSTQIVVEVSGLSVGEWRIEVTSRGLTSDTLNFYVNPMPPIVADFQAAVVDSPLGDTTSIIPCVNNWTAVSWRLHHCSRVEIRENEVLIHEEDLPGCGGPYEDLFTRLRPYLP